MQLIAVRAFRYQAPAGTHPEISASLAPCRAGRLSGCASSAWINCLARLRARGKTTRNVQERLPHTGGQCRSMSTGGLGQGVRPAIERRCRQGRRTNPGPVVRTNSAHPCRFLPRVSSTRVPCSKHRMRRRQTRCRRASRDGDFDFCRPNTSFLDLN